jgi:hypothetical protein
MSAIIRSLINTAQTLDSVSLPAWGRQTRAASTAALVAAVAAKTIQMDIVDDTNKQEGADETVYAYTPLTGTSQTVPADAEVVLVNPAGTIAAFTLTLPAASYDGQRITCCFDQVITALTMAASGSDTLKGALTAATAKGFATWRYRTADTSWYRVA